MAFTVNTNDTQEQQGLIIPGDYEVVIKEVTEGTSQQKGTPFIQLELVVRNDVNQEFKNKHVWYTIWDTPTTREKGIYAKQINTVSKHTGIQDGASFNSIADWGRFIQNRPVLATVKIEDYNGEKKERVSFISATKFPQCQHKCQAPNSGQGSNSQAGSSYGQGNQSYNNGGNQQPVQGANQNYNNGQQGNPSNQGYGNQNGGTPNQGNNGYYNNGQNVAGTGQAWQGNQQQNNIANQPQEDDDLPF